MLDRKIDVSNKMIIPGNEDLLSEEAKQSLLEDLDAIPQENLEFIGKSLDEAKDISTNQQDNLNFEELNEVEGSMFEYDRTKNLVRWKGRIFDLNTQLGESELQNEIYGIMKQSDADVAIATLIVVFDNDFVKLSDFLLSGFSS